MMCKNSSYSVRWSFTASNPRSWRGCRRQAVLSRSPCPILSADPRVIVLLGSWVLPDREMQHACKPRNCFAMESTKPTSALQSELQRHMGCLLGQIAHGPPLSLHGRPALEDVATNANPAAAAAGAPLMLIDAPAAGTLQGAGAA